MKISALYLVCAYHLRCRSLPVFGQVALRIATCHQRYCRLASIRQVACIFIAVWFLLVNCAISSCYVPSTMLNWIAVIAKFSFELKKVRFQSESTPLVHIYWTAVLAGSVRQAVKLFHVNCGGDFNTESDMLHIFENVVVEKFLWSNEHAEVPYLKYQINCAGTLYLFLVRPKAPISRLDVAILILCDILQSPRGQGPNIHAKLNRISGVPSFGIISLLLE